MHKIGMMSETIVRYKGMKGALKVIKDLGFDCADITFQTEYNFKKLNSYFSHKDYKKKAKELKDYAEKINLPLVQAHAPFPSFIADNPSYNKKEFLTLLKVIEMCGILKIKNLVIHPFNDYPDEVNIDFYKKLLPYAKKHNVIICTENMWRWDKENNHAKPCSCSFSDSFNNIIDGVNSPFLKGCVDIGHAEMFAYKNYSAKKMLLEMGKDRVACLHIHDNDQIKDRHWVPFKGSINFAEVIKALQDINYQGDFIAEISIDKNIKTLKERMEIYKENYHAMREIQRRFLER